MRMNIYGFITAIRDRPGIYFGGKKIDSINDIGFFIKGFLCAEESLNHRDEFDLFFKSHFTEFVRKTLNIEMTDFEFWFKTISKKVGDSGDAAIKMFFDIFDDFYSLYENSHNNF